jgi:hypothetical protein
MEHGRVASPTAPVVRSRSFWLLLHHWYIGAFKLLASDLHSQLTTIDVSTGSIRFIVRTWVCGATLSHLSFGMEALQSKARRTSHVPPHSTHRAQRRAALLTTTIHCHLLTVGERGVRGARGSSEWRRRCAGRLRPLAYGLGARGRG